MSNKRNLIIVGVIAVVAIAAYIFKGGSPKIQWAGDDPFVHLYDSKSASGEQLSTETFADLGGWKNVPESAVAYAFDGDTVFHNDKIIVVVRQAGNGIELYSIASSGPILQSTLVPKGNGEAQGLSQLSLVDNNDSRVEIEAIYSGSGGEQLGLNVELNVGQAFVKTAAMHDTKTLSVVAPTEHVVMPDFFADDIVIHAADVKADQAELPSEHFLMHMVDRGNAIVMSIWEDRDQEAKVTLGDLNGERVIEQSEIAFGDDGNIWVALLAEPNIWHERHIGRLDSNTELTLDWSQPFSAVWRVDWQRMDKLTDSWEMIVEMDNGKFRKTNILESSGDEWSDQDWWSGRHARMRITPGMGRYLYPCWIDINGAGYLQPLSGNSDISESQYRPHFRGPAIIYPINREADTPVDKYTITDMITSTLGQGPCEYILDVEGQGQEFKGLPTCTVRDNLNDIYSANQQSSKRADVLQNLDDVSAFIKMIRDRIGEYERFSRDTKKFLVSEKAKAGSPKAFIEDMEKQLYILEEAIEKRRPGMKTPAYARQVVSEFRNNLVGYSGSDAATKCKTLTAEMVEIGGNQDELVAECRQAVKIMRQHAAMAMANDPETVELAKLIRERCKNVLSKPVNYEAPRH